MGKFDGKAVLVTGAAQGMGRAIAQRFLEEGGSVVIFDLDAELLEKTAGELSALGPLAAVAGDVAARSDVHRAVAACDQFGGIDVLAAQAGIGDLCPLLEIDDARWNRMISVNLTGAFLSVQEAAFAMKAHGRGGAMVVTSSTNAFYVEQGTAHYSATKGGVLTFVRNAALDLAEFGIRINTVCPGIIRTRLGSPLIDDPVAGPEYLKRVPLRRFGEPVEIANSILFLASDDASYITGEDLVVDGGTTLGVVLEIPDGSIPGELSS